MKILSFFLRLDLWSTHWVLPSLFSLLPTLASGNQKIYVVALFDIICVHKVGCTDNSVKKDVFSSKYK